MQGSPSSPSELAKAFDLLVEAVEDLEARGRTTASAGVKPEMQRLTAGAFDERRLGFNNFGAFVAAAEKAEAIIRIKTDIGHSAIKVARPRPRGKTVGADRPSPPRIKSSRIRSDLWHAFVDWRPEVKRAYDRSHDRAITFMAAPQAGESQKQTDARVGVTGRDPRFVPIEPISMDTHFAWIKEFVEAHEGNPLAVALHSAIAQSRPVMAFSHVIRADPLLAQEWRLMRLSRVAAEVTRWIEKQSLSLDPWERGEAPQALATQPASSIAGLSQIGDDSLRALVHHAVERMPAAELLRLSIPLEYLARQEK